MTKRMLIDTTHAEETRVVVLDGNRLDDYDVETSSKKQLKGNIYLAKIVRIEPSLQAAFVEYGGGRHGFLAFSEIHPDYYQIPVADRERLIALQEEEARAEEARADREDDEAEEQAPPAPRGRTNNNRRDAGRNRQADGERDAERDDAQDARQDAGPDAGVDIGADTHPDVPVAEDVLPHTPADSGNDGPGDQDGPADRPVIEMDLGIEAETVVADADVAEPDLDEDGEDGDEDRAPAPETVSGDTPDDGHAQRRTARFLRQYKIQEVMRRRQVILVQVVKEERGNKGAALTTYISLAGRFSVLMPNSPRGGGVSRKITSAADRRRLKEITQELEIPRGMGMIVRTAGAQRPRAEIRRDGEYLLRTWDDIRETTLASIAPCLVYEEASLIKRAIRDVYTRDVEEIVVDGEAGWKSAREFMRMLMPANANKVGLWREQGQTLFGHHGVEHHLDAMLQPTVQLRSGGYLVINQTEALVAIDVNSGRSTRERGIEETAFRTNMEAADEVARQLRLRDLAGLIVIDFIDMEVRRNNATVERRLKDALRDDRARIQVGSISHFGLLEMSRQRLRPSIAESSFVACPHCAGTGFVRGTESSALHVLRAIEEEAGKRKASEILVHVASTVALYVLNHKRAWLGEIEQRHGLSVHLAADDSLLPPNLRIDRIRPWLPPAAAAQPVAATTTAVPISAAPPPSLDPFEDAVEPETDGPEAEQQPRQREPAPLQPAGQERADAAGAETAGEGDENGRRRKRRRRRRGGRRENGVENGVEGEAEAEAGSDEDAFDDATPTGSADAGAMVDPDAASGTDRPVPSTVSDDAATAEDADVPNSLDADSAGSEAAPRGRRRRGGRNRNRTGEPGTQSGRENGGRAEAVETEAVRPAPRTYNGPTPADPFAGAFDIFEMIERDAEESVVMPAMAASAASHQPATPVASPAPSEHAPDPATDRASSLAPVDEGLAEAVPAPEAALVVAEADLAGTDASAGSPPSQQPDPLPAAEPFEAVPAAEAEPAAGPKPRKPRAPRARKTPIAAVVATEETASSGTPQPAAEPEAVPAALTEPTPDPAPAKARRKPAARTRKPAPATPDAAAATAMVPEAMEPEAAAPNTASPADGTVANATAVADADAVPAATDATPGTDAASTATAPAADRSIIQPRVIDDSAPPAARRTGWWKR